jgi:hypothetical protein
MKKTILALLAVVLVLGAASTAFSQGANTYRTLVVFGTAAGDTSVNSAFDTSAAFQIGSFPIVSFDVYSLDKVNLLNVHILQQQAGKSGYAVVDSVVAWNGNSEGVLNRKEFMLRGGGTNKLPGLISSFKLRPQFAGSGNDNARVYIRVHYGGN